MVFVHGTNVYVWKERLFGKPIFRESRLSLHDNGIILWEKEEHGKRKGTANLKEVFPNIRVGALENEMKKERANEEGLVLAYHTLTIPLELSTPTTQPGLHEREFSVAFERQIYDWIQSISKVMNMEARFHDIVLKYRLHKKYNAYSGSTHHGLAQVEETLNAADDEDPARLWSAAHGPSEDYVGIWTAFQEQAIAEWTSSGNTNENGYCAKCW